MNADLLAALLIGFLGSSHCLVMCGGIVAALQLAMPGQSFWQRFRLQLLLSLGRISSYALFGALIGYFGMQAMQLAGLSLVWLRLIAGLLMLAMALYVARLWFGLTYLERPGRYLWRLLQPISQKCMPINNAKRALGYGFCWGWLPCGLVYSALSWSLASGSALDGSLFMLMFGLGTLPGLLLFGSAANTLSRIKNLPLLRYSAAVLLATYALYTIWLALQRLTF
ncbi:sulfite exporter TauE/SafE family protein [Arsukibacterium sp.]|uniref:sulfite exporter TauE/SafE family protein n=1 Tax=Arsukibacterium sp. TaxID=1977258 RepID=UPI002FD99743